MKMILKEDALKVKQKSKNPLFQGKIPSFSYFDCIKNLSWHKICDDFSEYSSSSYFAYKSAKFYVKNLTFSQELLLAFLFGGSLSLRYVGFSRSKMSLFLGISEKTIDRAMHTPLFFHESGKYTYNANRYFLEGLLFTKKLRSLMVSLIKRNLDITYGSFLEKCPTSIKNIILRVVYKLREYINSGSSWEYSSSSHDTNNFFPRKKKKVVVSECVCDKKLQVESDCSPKRPEKGVFSKHFLDKDTVLSKVRDSYLRSLIDKFRVRAGI